MGCDIHSFAERRNKDTNKWEVLKNHFTLDEFDKDWYKKEKGDSPFDWRSYSMFSFLAGVRNYDRCKPISEPKGLPDDLSQEVSDEYENWEDDAHSSSWLSLRELVEFDYDQIFWNRRVMKQISDNHWNGACLAEEGEGSMVTYRENLGGFFFVHLEDLRTLGDLDDVRVVFWFDN